MMCAKHGIEQVLSPSHTTHRLQPCDVAVFSPLATAYKNTISEASINGTRINKRTLPSLYAKARTVAFKCSTIKTAFRKSGIWPLDRTAIEDEAYEPSKNTSNQASMPIPVTCPEILAVVVTEEPVSPVDKIEANLELPKKEIQVATSHSPPTDKKQSDIGPRSLEMDNVPAARFMLAGLIPPSSWNATKDSLRNENLHLRQLLEKAKEQIEADYAHKLLMEDENRRIREELHSRKKPERKRAPGEGEARLMTASEQLDALALYDWKRSMENVLHSTKAKEIFKERKLMIKSYEDMQLAEAKQKTKAEQLQIKTAEKTKRQLEAALQRTQKADEKRKEGEQQKAVKEMSKAADKLRKDEEKRAKAGAKQLRQPNLKRNSNNSKSTQQHNLKKQLLDSEAQPSIQVAQAQVTEPSVTACTGSDEQGRGGNVIVGVRNTIQAQTRALFEAQDGNNSCNSDSHPSSIKPFVRVTRAVARRQHNPVP